MSSAIIKNCGTKICGSGIELWERMENCEKGKLWENCEREWRILTAKRNVKLNVEV